MNRLTVFALGLSCALSLSNRAIAEPGTCPPLRKVQFSKDFGSGLALSCANSTPIYEATIPAELVTSRLWALGRVTAQARLGDSRFRGYHIGLGLSVGASAYQLPLAQDIYVTDTVSLSNVGYGNVAAGGGRVAVVAYTGGSGCSGSGQILLTRLDIDVWLEDASAACQKRSIAFSSYVANHGESEYVDWGLNQFSSLQGVALDLSETSNLRTISNAEGSNYNVSATSNEYNFSTNLNIATYSLQNFSDGALQGTSVSGRLPIPPRTGYNHLILKNESLQSGVLPGTHQSFAYGSFSFSSSAFNNAVFVRSGANYGDAVVAILKERPRTCYCRGNRDGKSWDDPSLSINNPVFCRVPGPGSEAGCDSACQDIKVSDVSPQTGKAYFGGYYTKPGEIENGGYAGAEIACQSACYCAHDGALQCFAGQVLAADTPNRDQLMPGKCQEICARVDTNFISPGFNQPLYGFLDIEARYPGAAVLCPLKPEATASNSSPPRAVAASATLPPLETSRWSGAFSDAEGWNTQAYYWKTIRFPDLNGDGRSDVCGRSSGGLYCALSTGLKFAPPSWWSGGFSNSGGWHQEESRWGTLQYADLNGDGSQDVCARGSDGFTCALSTGTAFTAPRAWTSAFSNAEGWNLQPNNWKTIQLADLNGDGKADVCGRSSGGLYCALSTGTSFAPPTWWTSGFSNSGGWNVSESYWGTLQFADVNGDGKKDACARGQGGVYCALSNGSSFSSPSLWVASFTDAQGWTNPSFWKTLRLRDVSSDGKADACGRGADGVYCALSNGSSFSTYKRWTTDFSDAGGWGTSESFWGTVGFPNGNGDRRVDICGRSSAGIQCAMATGAANFSSLSLRTSAFSNAGGWSAQPYYWGTIQFPDVDGDSRSDACGRFADGIYCAISSVPR